MAYRWNWMKTIVTHSDRTKSVLLAVMIVYLLADIVLGSTVPGSAVLRPVIGIVLTTVLPGYVLVLLLGLGDRPPGRIALYSIGLSLPLVVALSIAVNTLSVFSIPRPLSALSLAVAVSLLTVGSSYVRYAGFGSSIRSPVDRLPLQSPLEQFSLSRHDWIALAAVSLLPVGSSLLTVFTSATGSNRLFIVLLCSISVVPIALLRWRGTPVLYPYAIWAVSAAVLLQMTLVSGHLWGFDIHYEYYSAAEILQNGHWDFGRVDPSNTLVTVTLLASVYSMVTGLELVWVYKIIYPLLVSLLPVGIWYIVQSEFADRSIATLSPFVLVFYYGFFKDMPDKQLVAGLFSVLLLVVFLDEGLTSTQRWVIGLTLAAGQTVSHYGVSLLFAAFLGFALLVRYALGVVRGMDNETLDNSPIDSDAIDIDVRLTRPALVGFLVACWIVWYLFTASGMNFDRVVGIGATLLESLPFPSSGRSGAAYATTGFESWFWIVYKLLHILLLGLIGVGLLGTVYTIITDAESDRSTEYTLLAAGVFGFLVASVVVTFGLGFDRTLQIALFVLTPFAIVGAKDIASAAAWLTTRLPPSLPVPTGLLSRIDALPIKGLFAVFLAVLFLFSSGTVFAVGGEQVPPYNINYDEEAGWPVYSQSEVNATRWLANHTDGNRVAVYNEWEQIKSRDGLLVSEVIPADELEPIWLNRTSLNHSAYVYVSQKPMKKLHSDTEYIDVTATPFYQQTLAEATVVYRNKKVTIYHVSG